MLKKNLNYWMGRVSRFPFQTLRLMPDVNLTTGHRNGVILSEIMTTSLLAKALNLQLKRQIQIKISQKKNIGYTRIVESLK